MPRRKIVSGILRLALLLAVGAFAAWQLDLFPAGDQTLAVSPGTMQRLAELRAQPKYVDVPGTVYTGMRPESSRVIAEAQLNQLIDRLRSGLPSQPSKKFVLAEFAKTMAEFQSPEIEDREQLLRYLEEIMDILNIDSSGGLFNRWLYGHAGHKAGSLNHQGVTTADGTPRRGNQRTARMFVVGPPFSGAWPQGGLRAVNSSRTGWIA